MKRFISMLISISMVLSILVLPSYSVNAEYENKATYEFVYLGQSTTQNPNANNANFVASDGTFKWTEDNYMWIGVQVSDLANIQNILVGNPEELEDTDDNGIYKLRSGKPGGVEQFNSAVIYDSAYFDKNNQAGGPIYNKFMRDALPKKGTSGAYALAYEDLTHDGLFNSTNSVTRESLENSLSSSNARVVGQLIKLSGNNNLSPGTLNNRLFYEKTYNDKYLIGVVGLKMKSLSDIKSTLSTAGVENADSLTIDDLSSNLKNYVSGTVSSTELNMTVAVQGESSIGYGYYKESSVSSSSSYDAAKDARNYFTVNQEIKVALDTYSVKYHANDGGSADSTAAFSGLSDVTDGVYSETVNEGEAATHQVKVDETTTKELETYLTAATGRKFKGWYIKTGTDTNTGANTYDTAEFKTYTQYSDYSAKIKDGVLDVYAIYEDNYIKITYDENDSTAAWSPLLTGKLDSSNHYTNDKAIYGQQASLKYSYEYTPDGDGSEPTPTPTIVTVDVSSLITPPPNKKFKEWLMEIPAVTSTPEVTANPDEPDSTDSPTEIVTPATWAPYDNSELNKDTVLKASYEDITYTLRYYPNNDAINSETEKPDTTAKFTNNASYVEEVVKQTADATGNEQETKDGVLQYKKQTVDGSEVPVPISDGLTPAEHRHFKGWVLKDGTTTLDKLNEQTDAADAATKGVTLAKFTANKGADDGADKDVIPVYALYEPDVIKITYKPFDGGVWGTLPTWAELESGNPVEQIDHGTVPKAYSTFEPLITPPANYSFDAWYYDKKLNYNGDTPEGEGATPIPMTTYIPTKFTGAATDTFDTSSELVARYKATLRYYPNYSVTAITGAHGETALAAPTPGPNDSSFGFESSVTAGYIDEVVEYAKNMTADGNNVQSKVQNADRTYTDDDIDSKLDIDDTKGREFDDWYLIKADGTDEALTDKTDLTQSYKTDTEGNILVYAKYKYKTYTVTYKVGDGEWKDGADDTAKKADKKDENVEYNSAAPNAAAYKDNINPPTGFNKVKGWKITKKGTEAQTGNDYYDPEVDVVTDDLELTADYMNGFTVTFYGNNGEWTVNPAPPAPEATVDPEATSYPKKSVTIDFEDGVPKNISEVLAPNTPKYEGHAFQGWYKKVPSATQNPDTPTVTPAPDTQGAAISLTDGGVTGGPAVFLTVSSDEAYYAMWDNDKDEEDYKTVKFDKNGGDTDAVPNNLSYSGTESLQDVHGGFPTEPTKTGYGFMGWYYNKSGDGVALTVSETLSTYVAQSEAADKDTVYARWDSKDENALTVHFATVTESRTGLKDIYYGGAYTIGDGTIKDKKITPNDAIGDALPLSNLEWKKTSESITFAGWYTEAGGKGTQIKKETPITADMDTDSDKIVNLYPYWSIAVTFDLNGADETDSVLAAYSTAIATGELKDKGIKIEDSKIIIPVAIDTTYEDLAKLLPTYKAADGSFDNTALKRAHYTLSDWSLSTTETTGTAPDTTTITVPKPLPDTAEMDGTTVIRPAKASYEAWPYETLENSPKAKITKSETFYAHFYTNLAVYFRELSATTLKTYTEDVTKVRNPLIEDEGTSPFRKFFIMTEDEKSDNTKWAEVTSAAGPTLYNLVSDTENNYTINNIKNSATGDTSYYDSTNKVSTAKNAKEGDYTYSVEWAHKIGNVDALENAFTEVSLYTVDKFKIQSADLYLEVKMVSTVYVEDPTKTYTIGEDYVEPTESAPSPDNSKALVVKSTDSPKLDPAPTAGKKTYSDNDYTTTFTKLDTANSDAPLTGEGNVFVDTVPTSYGKYKVEVSTKTVAEDEQQYTVKRVNYTDSNPAILYVYPDTITVNVQVGDGGKNTIKKTDTSDSTTVFVYKIPVAAAAKPYSTGSGTDPASDTNAAASISSTGTTADGTARTTLPSPTGNDKNYTIPASIKLDSPAFILTDASGNPKDGDDSADGVQKIAIDADYDFQPSLDEYYVLAQYTNNLKAQLVENTAAVTDNFIMKEGSSSGDNVKFTDDDWKPQAADDTIEFKSENTVAKNYTYYAAVDNKTDTVYVKFIPDVNTEKIKITLKKAGTETEEEVTVTDVAGAEDGSVTASISGLVTASYSLETATDDKTTYKYNEIIVKVYSEKDGDDGAKVEDDSLPLNKYKFQILRKAVPGVHLSYGNSPAGYVYRDDKTYPLEADKIAAMANFKISADAMLFTGDFDPPIIGQKTGNTITFGVNPKDIPAGSEQRLQNTRPYSTKAWTISNYEKNYDLDEYALFVYLGQKFVDPGFDAVDELGSKLTVTVTANVKTQKQGSCVPQSLTSTLSPLNLRSTASPAIFTESTGVYNLFGQIIRPDKYEIKYECEYPPLSTEENPTKVKDTKYRPLIILGRIGEVTLKPISAVSGDDAVEVIRNNDGLSNGSIANSIVAFRSADVKKEGTVAVNDNDGTTLRNTSGALNALKMVDQYYPPLYN